MGSKYSVTYKVSEGGAEYVYQEAKGKHNKGDVSESLAGHMWYVLSDGVKAESVGFESRDGVWKGEGRLSTYDDVGYKQSIYEVTLELSKEQYDNLSRFSRAPSAQGGFDTTKYNAFTNSCVDFAYASLKVLGYNHKSTEGKLLPSDNVKVVGDLLYGQGAKIIRDDLTRHKDYYDAKEARQCIWLGGAYPLQSPAGAPSPANQINIDIIPSPQSQKSVQGESKAQQDVANGFIHNASTHKIFALGGILNNTDFASTQMASMASGGIRPGEAQLDPNARPNAYLSQFYQTPTSTKPDFSLRNAVTMNGLAAMTTFNTYVDPLLLDLTGKGVHMTDLQDAVLFDTDNSGTLKRTGWADRTTGMLVFDDGNGQIKNVSQMFSEYYRGKAGVNGVAGEERFKDGFEALGKS